MNSVALIWEAAERIRTEISYFNKAGKTFRCKFTQGTGNTTWRIEVPIQIPQIEAGEPAFQPPKHGASVLVKVLLRDLEFPEWRGTIFDSADKSVLLIIVRNPEGNYVDQLMTNHSYLCRVELRYLNINLHKELSALQLLCLPQLLPANISIDRFSLVEVVCGMMDPERAAVDLRQEFSDLWTGTQDEYVVIMKHIHKVREPLTRVPQQKRFFDRSLIGKVRGCVLLWEGRPGCGKTTVDARLAIALGLMGYRVLMTANTNVAVNAFIQKVYEVLDELETFFPGSKLVSSLKDHIIHIHSNAIESRIGRQLEAGNAGTSITLEEEEEIDDGDDKIDSKFLFASMTHRMDEWARQNLWESFSPEYQLHPGNKTLEVVRFNEQMRAKKEIAAFTSPPFYGGRVVTNPNAPILAEQRVTNALI
ncbi:hypothetical protein K491DRAFT_775496 [Lophiostoma macrostomum CBS 122681]|uniref:DNA2/NAM7 helicase helicase domain-containing protein n=1 Tax=Lophiostoma macrostomum CBS 122681 TaxID=1314788 RepID=A0A6A6TLS9_9PLEO|nr:hypothetical protein K491DRAFT_775496 [Lophiostoma macrostomum CBS 122681]